LLRYAFGFRAFRAWVKKEWWGIALDTTDAHDSEIRGECVIGSGPYITIKFEAQDQETYDARRLYVRTLLESYPEMIWKDQLVVNLHALV